MDTLLEAYGDLWSRFPIDRFGMGFLGVGRQVVQCGDVDCGSPPRQLNAECTSGRLL